MSDGLLHRATKPVFALVAFDQEEDQEDEPAGERDEDEELPPTGFAGIMQPTRADGQKRDEKPECNEALQDLGAVFGIAFVMVIHIKREVPVPIAPTMVACIVVMVEWS